MDDCGYCANEGNSGLLFCSDIKDVYFSPSQSNMDGGQMITLTSDCFGNNDKLLVTCNFDSISVQAKYWGVNTYVCLAPLITDYTKLIYDFSVTLGYRAFQNAIADDGTDNDNQFIYVAQCGALARQTYHTVGFNETVVRMRPGKSYDLIWDPDQFRYAWFFFVCVCVCVSVCVYIYVCAKVGSKLNAMCVCVFFF